jgi:hypothetical protein
LIAAGPEDQRSSGDGFCVLNSPTCPLSRPVSGVGVVVWSPHAQVPAMTAMKNAARIGGRRRIADHLIVTAGVY